MTIFTQKLKIQFHGYNDEIHAYLNQDNTAFNLTVFDHLERLFALAKTRYKLVKTDCSWAHINRVILRMLEMWTLQT